MLLCMHHNIILITLSFQVSHIFNNKIRLFSILSVLAEVKKKNKKNFSSDNEGEEMLESTTLMTEALPYSHCRDPTARQRQHCTLNNSLVMAAIRATLCLFVCFLFQLFFLDTFFCEGILFILCHHSLVGLLDAQTFVVGDLTLGWENTHSFSFQRYFYHGVYVRRTTLFWG